VPYYTDQVAAIYGVTPQTVNKWAREFADYLTAGAKPGGNKTRQFDSEDMMVFSLVSEMQKKHLTFSDIHASLKSGARGEPPLIEPEQIQAIVEGQTETRISLENERLKAMLIDAQTALQKAEKDLKRLREVEDENIRLKAQMEIKDQQQAELANHLKEQVEKLEARVEQLAKEAGQQYAVGYKSGFTDREVTQRTNDGEAKS
jgi:DNA-binding transcriptional MerR regulator